MNHFAAIALPGPAYRRSFFADAILRQTSTFVRLLCQLAPMRYARLQDKSPISVYWELIAYCNTLFPTFDLALEAEDWGEGAEGEDYDEASAAEEFGIPIDLCGPDDYELAQGSSPSLGYIAYLVETDANDGDRLPLENMSDGMGEAWRHIRALKPFHARPVKSYHAPHGRQWAGDWQALTELVEYVQHKTGHLFLDNSNQEIAEMGESYAPWDIEHIRWYAQEWKRAQPVMQRIDALQKWIDGYPSERLPLLAAAITGDEEVRRQLSRPKKSKQLVDIWH